MQLGRKKLLKDRPMDICMRKVSKKGEGRDVEDGSTCPGDRSKSVGRFRTGNGPGFTVDGQIVSMKIAMASPRWNVPISRGNNDTAAYTTRLHAPRTRKSSQSKHTQSPIVVRRIYPARLVFEYGDWYSVMHTGANLLYSRYKLRSMGKTAPGGL